MEIFARDSCRRLTITLVALAISGAAGSSESKADCVAEAQSAIPKVNSPGTLYHSFLVFRGCNDGVVAELFTEIITHMLALQWASVSQLQSLAATDSSFREFILKHLDSTTPAETLRRIDFNAQHYCPDRSQSFCAEVRHAIEVVLRELPASSLHLISQTFADLSRQFLATATAHR